MTESKSKPIYAPLPARAVADDRLNGLPLRVLAAVALRDRLSIARGGKGCFASNQVLCIDCRCDEATLSRAITQLVDLGYLHREGTQRSRVLRVIYLNYDADTASRKAFGLLHTRKTHRGRVLPTDQSSFACEQNNFDKSTVHSVLNNLIGRDNPSLIYSSNRTFNESLNRNGSEDQSDERIEQQQAKGAA